MSSKYFENICLLEEITLNQELFQTVRGITLDFQEDLYSDMMISI